MNPISILPYPYHSNIVIDFFLYSRWKISIIKCFNFKYLSAYSQCTLYILFLKTYSYFSNIFFENLFVFKIHRIGTKPDSSPDDAATTIIFRIQITDFDYVAQFVPIFYFDNNLLIVFLHARYLSSILKIATRYSKWN